MLAVALQAFFRVNSAPAYGICIACHGQELAAWVAPFRISGIAALGFPLLTTVGVVFGAAIAAARNRELRRPRGRFVPGSTVLGLGVGFAAIITAGCPTRLWLRFAYGDGSVVLLVAGLVGGIVTAVALMRWRATRA